MQEKSKDNEQKNKKGLNFMETGINCARQLRNYMSLILRHHEDDPLINPIDNFMMFHDIFFIDHYLDLENNNG